MFPHGLGRFAVNIHGEGCAKVPQVISNGLNAVPALNGVDGVAVAQVVETALFHADGGDNFLVVLVDRWMIDRPAQLVGEYKVLRVFPRRASRNPISLLMLTLLFQHLQYALCCRDLPGLAVLRSLDHPVAALFYIALTLAAHVDNALVPVNVLPLQPDHLRLPHPGEQGDNEDTQTPRRS